MKKTITLFAALLVMSANAQEQETIKTIDENVAEQINTYKKSLQDKIDAVNRAVAKGLLTKEEGVKIIEKLQTNKIETLASNVEYAVEYGSLDWSAYETDTISAEVSQIDWDSLQVDAYDWDSEVTTSEVTAAEVQEVKPKLRLLKKTGYVLGVSFGNLAKDNHFPNSEYSYSRSNSAEWGIVSRVPFSKEKPTVGLKYGLTFNYYQLHTTDNKIFVKDGENVATQTFDHDLKRNKSYLRNTYITIPLMLDFDFSKKDFDEMKGKFVEKGGLKVALGGYVGYNINSKQFIKYKNEFGHMVSEKQRGEWNATDFQYGLQASVGYKNIHLVGKYDLNDMFKNQPVNMQFWSLGLRFEFLN